jgi:hypothetical protein
MKKNILFCAVILITAFCFADESFSLASEIMKVKEELSKQKISQSEKHFGYVKLGRLLNLSGDIEASAAAWMRAAYAEKGKRDDTALLESAACYISMGEWDKADANVKMVLLTVRDNKEVFFKAKYLAAQIEAFQNGNDVILNSIVDDPEYKSARPAIYLTLWKLTGKDEYKAKLINEYPESPETRTLVAESTGKNQVADASSSQWFLYPGRENIVTDNITPSNAPEGVFEAAAAPTLQIGVFNSIENAQLQVDKLRDSGFASSITRRISGDDEYWSVTVPGGGSLNQTIIALKAAGYNSFQVY